MREYMRISIAMRTRSDGEWVVGEKHHDNLEIGGNTMYALTSVQKCQMVLEIYEQQTRYAESEIQQARWYSGVVSQRKVEQRSRNEMPLSTGDTHEPYHGTSPKDNNDICT